MTKKFGFGGIVELPGHGKEEEASLEDWEYPETDKTPKKEIDEIVARESFKKVQRFCNEKKRENINIHVLLNGNYIAEILDQKGEQEEVYYFDKNGDLMEFVDRRKSQKELEKELKETAKKIMENFQKIQAAMVDMLVNDPVYSKTNKH